MSQPSASPIVIPPSLYWKGDDGNWSTFYVEAGNPGQALQVLPGTSAGTSNIFWFVIEEGCADVNPTLSTCADDRGGLFLSNKSTTWSTQQLGSPLALYDLVTIEEKALGLTGNGSYGFDTIALGAGVSTGLPTLTNQSIAGIWTNDFYIGQLPLSPYSCNLSTYDSPLHSMLSVLRSNSTIPSLSWSYTAGAFYQDSTTSKFGSLVLGGYDASRFQPNNVSFNFGPDFTRDLLLTLTSITYTTTANTVTSSPLLASSIDIFIDSLVSEIWLPSSVCDAFAKTFNLTYNTQAGLYLISDDAHAAILSKNPTFDFTFANGGSNSQSVSISLPYAAFDLNLTSPIVGDTTRYFPIKRAQNESQYVLGRTFLQEAYIIADYDRHNFSVSQARFPATSVQQKVVAIHAPGYSEDGQNNSHGGSSLGGGAIAGIVVAVMILLALIITTSFLVWRWSKRKTKAAAQKSHKNESEHHERPELHDEPKQDAELEGDYDPKQGLLSNTVKVEIADTQRHEVPGTADPKEMDAVTRPHELSSYREVHELPGSMRTMNVVELESSEQER